MMLLMLGIADVVVCSCQSCKTLPHFVSVQIFENFLEGPLADSLVEHDLKLAVRGSFDGAALGADDFLFTHDYCCYCC